MDIISAGELLIDFTPSELPWNYTANPGGAPANVAIAAARNGLHVGFLGTMGNDDFGRMLVSTLEQDHVEVLCPVLKNEAITTLAFVTIFEDGDRSFTFARKPGADMLLNISDIDDNLEKIRNCRIFNAGSFSLSSPSCMEAILKAMKVTKESSHIVSFDINYRNAVWENEAKCKTEVDKLLPYIDLLKISDEELYFVGGEDNIPAFMQKNHITVLIETLGAKGAKYYLNDNLQMKTGSIAGMTVKAVDATGAGDAFWGGFLSKLLMSDVNNVSDISQDIVESALKYGNVSGGLCVQKKGGIPALPTKEEINDNMML